MVLAGKLTIMEKMGTLIWKEMVDAFSHVAKICMQHRWGDGNVHQPVKPLYACSVGPGKQQGRWRGGSWSLRLNRGGEGGVQGASPSVTGLEDPWS